MSWTQIVLAPPLGPWLTFAVQTAPPAAVLVFIFVLLVAAIFVLLLICAGDPNRMLRMLLLLGPIAGAYCAIYVSGMIAIAGWPIMQIIERTFGLSGGSEAWVISLLNLNYVSLTMDALASVGLVVVLLIGAIWREQAGQHQRASEQQPELTGVFDKGAEGHSAEQAQPSSGGVRERQAQVGLAGGGGRQRL